MINKIKETLHLEPLPMEGGFYCETYRSNVDLPVEVLPNMYEETRSISTAIFYLLTPDTHSAIHKLPGDEIYHFYLGDPVELLKLQVDGSAEIVILGKQILEGMKLQEVVRAGTYQGARLKPGGSFALLGTTMAPGFEFDDFIAGNAEALSKSYPEYSDLISELS